MSEISNKAQELKGKAEQAVAGATGDRSKQAEGLKDEKSGQAKQAADKVKDVFK